MAVVETRSSQPAPLHHWLSVPEKQLEMARITGSGLFRLTPNCPAGLWGRSLEDQVNQTDVTSGSYSSCLI